MQSLPVISFDKPARAIYSFQQTFLGEVLLITYNLQLQLIALDCCDRY